MRNILLFFLLLLGAQISRAQTAPFEGTIKVSFTNEKSATTIADIKVKGKQVYIKQTQNGHKKYSGFIINLDKRELYTLSQPEKKVCIKYNYDSLLNYYQREGLKDGYVKNYDLELKETDKTKKEGDNNLVKAVGENNFVKITAWLSDAKTPLNDLVPFLRLLANWNETEGGTKLVTEAEVNNKVSKKESKLKVEVKKETVAKETFDLPKDYVQKDFATLMVQQKGTKELRTVIETFGEF